MADGRWQKNQAAPKILRYHDEAIAELSGKGLS